MATPDAPRGGPPPGRPNRLWPALVTLVVLLAAAFGAALYTLGALGRGVASFGERTVDGLERVAQAFRAGTVTTTFLSYATEVAGVSRLQVASLRQTEQFERSDRATAFWGTLELPELVVRITAPVDYAYYVDLEEPWHFDLDGRRVRVTTPRLRWGPPAVDVSRLEYEVRRGSLLRDEDEAMERLRRGIGRMAHARARENLPLVREIARRQIAHLVRAWLARTFELEDDVAVEVEFADEVEPLLRIAPGEMGG